ncbi:basic leucine zipper 6-like [Glycine max]|uniref:basic leucine zipper 6-like n=1 Tax=Glycine max TaxID=3847 RepID=UPI001B357D41|nr:basic leucine zipper 6-like [Glycine max]
MTTQHALNLSGFGLNEDFIHSDNRIVRMGEAAKKICLASLKDQSCHVFGNAKGRTKLDLDLKLGISNIYSSQARDNHYNNHTFNQVEKNFIHGSSSTHDAGVNFNTNQTYEGQASKPGLNFNMATKMEDPKRLRRIMANRVSSKRYRLKKLDRMDQLEKQIKVIRQHISNFRRQIREAKKKQQLLRMEQHHLKFRIATFHDEKIVREAEIGKNREEVKRLRELHINQLQANAQPTMPNSNDGHTVEEQLDLNLGL